MPDSWSVQRARGARTERVSLEAGARRRSPSVPPNLPGGYVLASVERTVVRGRDSVTLTVRQPDSDLGAEPIRIHLEAAGALPSAVAADRVTMTLDGAEARWTPSQGRLEWIASASTARSRARAWTCGS